MAKLTELNQQTTVDTGARFYVVADASNPASEWVDGADLRAGIGALADTGFAVSDSGRFLSDSGRFLSDTGFALSDTGQFLSDTGQFTGGIQFLDQNVDKIVYWDDSFDQFRATSGAGLATKQNLDSGDYIVAFGDTGEGAVRWPFRNMMDRERVSVKDYGVVGDGSTDDTTQITRAIDQNPNKSICFPPGDYRTTSPVNVLQTAGHFGTMLEGVTAGFASARIVSSDTGSNVLSFQGADVNNFLRGCGIRNLNITRSVNNKGTGLYLAYVTAFNLENVHIDTQQFHCYCFEMKQSTFTRFAFWNYGNPSDPTHPTQATAGLSLDGPTSAAGGQGWINTFSDGWISVLGLNDTGLDAGIAIYHGDAMHFENIYVAGASLADVYVGIASGRINGSFQWNNVYFDHGITKNATNFRNAGYYVDHTNASAVGGLHLLTGCVFNNIRWGVLYDGTFAGIQQLLVNGCCFNGLGFLSQASGDTGDSACLQGNDVISMAVSGNTAYVGTFFFNGSNTEALTVVGNAIRNMTQSGIRVSGTVDAGVLAPNAFDTITKGYIDDDASGVQTTDGSNAQS